MQSGPRACRYASDQPKCQAAYEQGLSCGDACAEGLTSRAETAIQALVVAVAGPAATPESTDAAVDRVAEYSAFAEGAAKGASEAQQLTNAAAAWTCDAPDEQAAVARGIDVLLRAAEPVLASAGGQLHDSVTGVACAPAREGLRRLTRSVAAALVASEPGQQQPPRARGLPTKGFAASFEPMPATKRAATAAAAWIEDGKGVATNRADDPAGMTGAKIQERSGLTTTPVRPTQPTMWQQVATQSDAPTTASLQAASSSQRAPTAVATWTEDGKGVATNRADDPAGMTGAKIQERLSSVFQPQEPWWERMGPRRLR